jgi:hypothetical protein
MIMITISTRPAAAGDTPGATSTLQAGITFLDTTISSIVISDGAGNWRDPSSGEVV